MPAKTASIISLFTSAEHVILANWLGLSRVREAAWIGSKCSPINSTCICSTEQHKLLHDGYLGSGVRQAFVALACSVLMAVTASCGEARDDNRDQARKAEAALMTQLDRAESELERRLHHRVTNPGQGFLLVTNPLPRFAEFYAYPSSIVWNVECNMVGLTVNLGAASGEAGNGTDLVLTNATLSADQCRYLTPRIAQAMLALVRADQARSATDR